MYGESTAFACSMVIGMGLSPRVRGILTENVLSQSVFGSIPACTGNPVSSQRGSSRPRVYPRVYGESSAHGRNSPSFGGLSPRVRGIPHYATTARYGRRSIPACTGNPARAAPPRTIGRVYPRVYGESPKQESMAILRTGLSPRVRGIRRESEMSECCLRSIPACTGNPIKVVETVSVLQVYPRVYGESEPVSLLSMLVEGLSPRVRGIQITK